MSMNKKNVLESNLKPVNNFLNHLINLSKDNTDVFELLILNSLDRNLTTLYKLYETVEYYFNRELKIKLSNGLSNYEIYKTNI